jgi:hypothetical protein
MKVIPTTITKAIHIFFATFMINFGSETLISGCDKIQTGILWMVMKSEGDKIKLCTAPARDRKYVICAYTKLIEEFSQKFIDDSLKTVVSGLIELCRKSATHGFSTAS